MKIEIPDNEFTKFLGSHVLGYLSHFFLGISLCLFGLFISELTESFKYLSNHHDLLTSMTEKKEAKITEVYFKVVPNVSNWAGSQDINYKTHPGLSAMRVLQIEKDDKKFSRLFSSFHKASIEQTTLHSFMDEENLRKSWDFRNWKDEQKNIPYFVPKKIQLILTKKQREELLVQNDHHAGWVFKQEDLNRFNGMKMMLDEPLLILAFNWYLTKASEEYILVNFNKNHPEVFLPTYHWQEQVEFSPFELFINKFNPFWFLPGIIAFIIFFFFYALSRSFSRMFLNHPIVVGVFLISIPFWSQYYLKVDSFLFNRSLDENFIIQEFRDEWSASDWEYFSLGMPIDKINDFEIHELKFSESRWSKFLSNFEFINKHKKYKYPQEVLEDIYSDIERQVSKMKQSKKEELFHELVEIRDGKRAHLGCMERVYQILRVSL